MRVITTYLGMNMCYANLSVRVSLFCEFVGEKLAAQKAPSAINC